MAKQPDDASEEALRSDEEIADTADDEFDEEEESDEEEEEGETRGLTPEVGSEGGSPGDVELEDKTIPARGSEAGETWSPSGGSSQTTIPHDETGPGRRTP